MKNKTVVIIGGGAAGASCATRLRRLDERAKIIIIEEGPHVSFANCGLPYYVGNIIKQREKLFIFKPELFASWFTIEVRTGHKVESINRKRKTISVEISATQKTYEEKYDFLVLAVGAVAILPAIPGIDIPGIFSVRTIRDADNIIEWIETHEAKSAAIIGGGFVGLEMAESLRNREMRVMLIEMLGHIASFLDPEMAVFLEDHMETHGVELFLGDFAASFRSDPNGKIGIKLKSGKELFTDIVITAFGVKPDIRLASGAGLTIGESDGIETDDEMRTSDEDIFAAGDCVETGDAVLTQGPRFVVPLAGPAHREARIVAQAIIGTTIADTAITGIGKRENKRTFRGSQRTIVCGVFGMTVASTGTCEQHLRELKKRSDKSKDPVSGYAGSSYSGSIEYEKIFLSPLSSAEYYPGGSALFIKLLFSKQDGRILGAQALGMKGVEKRIDVISMAIQKNGTVFDLEEAELCYAPQYGNAKDPINLAGMIASNIVRRVYDIVHWEDLPGADVFLLDVRTNGEFEAGHVPGSMNIPLRFLRKDLEPIPREKEIWVYSQRGQRSYYAARILMQNDFNVRAVSGGYLMYEAINRLTF